MSQNRGSSRMLQRFDSDSMLTFESMSKNIETRENEESVSVLMNCIS